MSTDWWGAGGGQGRGGDLLRYIVQLLNLLAWGMCIMPSEHLRVKLCLCTGVGDTASHPLRHTAMVLIDRVAQIQEGISEHDTEGELQI